MRELLAFALGVMLIHFMPCAWALDKSAVEEKRHTPFDLYLSAREAYELKTLRPDEVLFVDVRTQQEVRYTGIADQIDANIPYRFDSLDWKTKSDDIHGTFRRYYNPDFSDAVANALRSRKLDKNSPVILMCMAGSRVSYAAHTLYKAGFKKVYIQVEGFEGAKAKSGEHKGKRVVAGWKVGGLPWSYDLVAAKMYFNFDPQQTPASSAEADSRHGLHSVSRTQQRFKSALPAAGCAART